MALEESFSLVDYKNTSGSAVSMHLFQEQADATITKMAKEILEAKSDGDVYILRNRPYGTCTVSEPVTVLE